MKSDITTRVLLTGILLLLVLLVFQQRRGAEATAGEGGAVGVGRFVLLPVRSAGKPVLLRGDTVTGELWHAEGIFGDAHWAAYGSPSAPEPAEASGPATGPDASEAPGSGTGPSAGAMTPAERDASLIAGAISPESPKAMRLWAVGELGGDAYDDAVAVPLLVQALEQPEPEVVIAAVEGLQRRKAATSAGAVRELLENPDPGVRAAARAALESFERPAAPPE
jgi:hypothetical protein